MNISIAQLIGVWRASYNNNVIDIQIRFGDRREDVWCLFTYYIYGENSFVFYEWRGNIEVQNFEDRLSKIMINNIREYQNEREDVRNQNYQSLKDINIWSFNTNEMQLQFGNEERVLFQKLESVFQ
ncbi:hypothetical protein [Myroides odoratimimus]|uniref:hypothetical protein n=1 Tax=Myroides odoratimimus TaxID=76832 RepID=UPI001CE0B464|nr:hypothetical protein [Myroides odoratimimus]MCA4792687.1 hypothetical protein [Myroides odoratimimus]MCA4819871.1 hypothetical protein [Myroides odoratimimus]MDM1401242.1 hypothetical protein [Myroides odoratimimus]MDM1457208.1 hypothetical protein [Myroides odoratimimus]MEC4085773.1 hypothetical protein [Myroides odoratimimus]